jgi:beta-lactamase regulating signal transducer with metallopeptidase domain
MTLLLDITLKATILLGLAGVLSVLLARQSPALRHFVWTLAVIGVLLVPVLSATFPHMTVRVASGLPGWIAPATPGPREAAPQAAAAGTGHAEIIESTLAAEGPAAAPAPLGSGISAEARSEAVMTSSVSAATVTKPESAVSLAALPWLGLLWSGGALVLLAALAGALAQLRAMTREAEPAHDPAVHIAASRAARVLGVSRPVRILYTPPRAMPMTWGLVYPVVLLPRDAASWPSSRLDAVLMHETAHVKRLDCLTQFLARILCALLWFHPLAWYAARQLRIERELACDDLVVRAGSRPSEYAGHLLEIARGCRATRLAAQASLPMARQSHIGRRLGAVLDAHRSREGVSLPAALVGVVLALLIVVPLAAARPVRHAVDETTRRFDTAPLPRLVAGTDWKRHAAATAPQPRYQQAQQPQQLLCDWTRRDNTSASTSIDNGRVRIRIEVDRCRLELEAEGEITFAEDYTDVTGIASSGWFTLEERISGSRRELEIEPTGTGLARRWRVDGDERPFDDDARQWFAEALLVVFRRTSYRAEERAAQILDRYGVQGLLDEIDVMTSGHAISKYYAVLFTYEELDPRTVQRIVAQAARRIESDHALGQVLIAVAESQPLDESAQAAYMTAAGSIDSDHQRRQVLSAILKRLDLSPEVAGAMLAAAAAIKSDHELGELLKELIAAYPLDRTMTPAFFAAVRSIDSDHQRHQVLSDLLERGAPGVEVLDATLALTEGMDSDHEVAELLLEVLGRYPPERALPPSFVAAARGIESDHNQRRVWAAVLEHPTVSDEAIAGALEAAGASIASDHQRTELLLVVVHRHTLDDALRPAFFTALNRTDSDHNRGQVLDAVIDQESRSKETALAVLDAAAAIASDHTLSQVLLHFAAVVEMDEELRSAYRRTASGISSDRTRERVLDRLGSG